MWWVVIVPFFIVLVLYVLHVAAFRMNVYGRIVRSCYGRCFLGSLIAHIGTALIFPRTYTMARQKEKNRGWNAYDRIGKTPVVVSSMPEPCKEPLPQRVRSVISLCHWYESMYFFHSWMCRGVMVHECPCIDRVGTLSMFQIDIAVDFIVRQAFKNNLVLVHCKGGTGRSAMIATCYLIRECKKTAEQAKATVVEYRPQTKLNGVKWETVQAYEKHCS